MTDTLPTLGLLAITDGRLMGDMGKVYAVVSHFIGRPAFTHELPEYADMAESMIAAQFPNLTGRRADPWQQVRDDALAAHGETVVVPDVWAGCLADAAIKETEND